MGLAGLKTSWQRQTRYFGHDRRDQYSVLILDNRGIGGSDKPLARYSTSEMARDVIEVLDHVGWTAEREINVIGISLGGMIAQEIACAIPTRLCSLSLICTSAALESTSKPLHTRVLDRLGLLLPKSQELSISETARQLFVDEWLSAPDEEDLPSPKTTPKCGPAVGSPDGEYQLFSNNFQRFQAQELTKRRTPGFFHTGGFVCQILAAGWHHKSAEQLRDMADKVGRERILVLHGTRDLMITVSNGESLIKMIEPGVGLIVKGLGHAPVMERAKWFNNLLEERLVACAKL